MKKLASFSRLVFFALAVPQLVSNCSMDSNVFKPVAPEQQSVLTGAETAYAQQRNMPRAAEQPAPVSSPATGETATAAAAPRNMPVAAERPSPALTRATADMKTDDYKISPQDILQIVVFQIKDLDSAVQVGEDGNVALPLIGKVQLRGKTTYEAEQIIAGKLREKYLQSPQVTVSIKQYGKRITVSGEVKTPRVMPDDGNTTLTQGIATAGGLSELGDPTRVHIARSRDQRVQDELYDLDQIQAGKKADPLLRGGDIVVAEQSGTRV